MKRGVWKGGRGLVDYADNLAQREARHLAHLKAMYAADESLQKCIYFSNEINRIHKQYLGRTGFVDAD